MATEPFGANGEEWSTAESGTDDSEDFDAVELDAGEHIAGKVVHHDPEAGYNGYVKLLDDDDGDVKTVWLNGQTARAMAANDLGEGSHVALVKTEEVRTFEDDDGEQREYNVWEVHYREN